MATQGRPVGVWLGGCLLVLAACTSGGVETASGTASTALTSPVPNSAGPALSGDDTVEDGSTGSVGATGSVPSSLEPLTTPGPAPSGGSVDEVETASAAPLTTVEGALSHTLSADDGVQVSVSSLESHELVGNGPGEVTGPGLLVTLLIENSSTTDLSIGNLTVTVLDADGQVAALVEDPATVPVPRSLSAGGVATGTLAFAVPEGARGRLRIEVEAEGIPAVVVFEGEAP